MAFSALFSNTRRSVRYLGIFIPKVQFKTHVLASPGLRSLIRTQSEVSTTLATRIFLHGSQSNIVLSPVSIHMVLSTLASGCKADAETLDKLLGFLRVKDRSDLDKMYEHVIPILFGDGSPSGGPTLSFANGVWVEKKLDVQPHFKEVMETKYKGTFKRANFEYQWEEVVKEVNSWITEKTCGLVTEALYPDESLDLVWVLFVNALYFKGAWSQVFERTDTQRHNFNLLGGGKIDVPFMTSKENQFVAEFNDFKVLGLHYLKGEDHRRYTMYILLPDAQDGLGSLLKNMSSTPYFLDRHLPLQKVKVGRFLLPKFKMCHRLDVLSIFKNLGLDLPSTGLDGLVREPLGDLYLFKPTIFHEAYVEVNEDGTKAAATSLYMGEGSSRTKDYVDFVADHPFLFIIREDLTKVVLLMGQVINPYVEEEEGW